MPPTDDPDALERYARAAAAAAGLAVEEGWWPAVVRHLGVLLDRAASLDGASLEGAAPGAGVDLPDDPAPVFRP